MEKNDQLNPETTSEKNVKGDENTDLEKKSISVKTKPDDENGVKKKTKKTPTTSTENKQEKKPLETPAEETEALAEETETLAEETETPAEETETPVAVKDKPESKKTKKQPSAKKTDLKKDQTGDAKDSEKSASQASGEESGPAIIEPSAKDEEKESAAQKDTEKIPEDPLETKSDKTLHGEPKGKDDEKHDEEDYSEKYSELSKEELVNAIELIVENDDISHIRKHIGYIKAAFRKILKDENLDKFEQGLETETETEKEEVEDPLAARFDKAFERYKAKKAAYDKTLEKQKYNNLAEKEKILEELRKLIDSDEELKHTYDMFRELQEKWKDIGPVPQNAKSTLWNNYHFLVEKFFDKVKINKELKDLDLKKNLEAKTELCEKAEELLLESSVTKTFQKLQKLHEAWKETGPVSKDKKDEIWERFKAATDKLNKHRSEFYQNLREEQEKNYAAKLLLCEKAEAILEIKPDSPKKWQENSEDINELFRTWKTIGFAPRKFNNEVWNRFRTALDTFFKNKKEFFKDYKEQQNDNYNQKVNLCMQAEALKDNEDWKKTTDQLIALQKEWKNIGPVPAKLSDKIWKRFRAACDEFFNRKADFFSNINQRQSDNLKKKLDLIEKIKTYNYSDNNNKNLELLQNFQREWMEIGHVPIKEKDKIQGDFRKAIDEQFEKLNISKKVKNTMAFKSKIDNVKEAPNADNIIYKERSFIINKISHLKSDINLWENNIGFFASSKKADVLKSEFQQKIDKAKQEIEILEEKLKILKEAY